MKDKIKLLEILLERYEEVEEELGKNSINSKEDWVFYMGKCTGLKEALWVLKDE